MPPSASELLTVAIPKGRVLPSLAERFGLAGVEVGPLLAEDRRLIRPSPRSGLRFLLLKPDDVPTYVEYGVADLGVVGRDVLLEQPYDLYTPLDLGIGRCRMAVAGLPESAVAKALLAGGAGGADALLELERPLRVATKFRRSARRAFEEMGLLAEIIYVQSSVELAPLTGLADLIVDLVETGETLRQNGLAELLTLREISTVVVANRAGLKLKADRIRPLLRALREGASTA